MSPQPSPPDSARPLTGTLRVAVGAGLTVVAALVGLMVSAQRGDPDPAVAAGAPAGMVAVSPGGVVEPEDVPPALVGHYRTAVDHYDTFTRVPCFCGCEEMLGHRHLADCFVRADGQGWEAHALGCGVCLGEAQQVADLLAAGTTDPAEITQAVVAVWADPYTDDSEESP